MSPVSRRRLLLGVGAVSAAAASTSLAACTPASPAPVRMTVELWQQNRRAPYLIGHRGAGGVRPEHTLPSYLDALAWGVECLEISVVMSSDNVLYCHHDLTLDRTTTLNGSTRQPSSVLDTARVNIPRLGPAWQGENRPRMPRLADVLTEVGGRAVLCIEPKDDAAYPHISKMVAERGLKDSVMMKLDYSSMRIKQAKDEGFPVFAYLGNAKVAVPENITGLAARLDPKSDCMVLPATTDEGPLAAALVQQAVASGVPVWVFPVHRRSEADYFAKLGVQGLITADCGYIGRTVDVRPVDAWSAERLDVGEKTRFPYSDKYGLSWSDDSLVLASDDHQPWVMLGQIAPITAKSYRISVDVCLEAVPGTRHQGISIAFGHADDAYYQHRFGADDGYHGVLRSNGLLELFSHTAGKQEGDRLAEPVQTPSLELGEWSRLLIDVTPDLIRWSRDGASLEVQDSRFRGGYVHIGCTAPKGRVRVRRLQVS